MQTKLAQRNYARSLAAGWTLILLISFALYDGLLYDGLRREIRSQALSMASMNASVVNMKISTGLRLGKDLRRFMGLEGLLLQAKQNFPAGDGIAVLDAEGNILASLGEAAGAEIPQPDEEGPLIAERPGHLDLYAPITDRRGGIVGYTLVRLSSDRFAETAFPLLRRVMLPQAVTGAAAMVLLFSLLYRGSLTRRRRLSAVCLGIFFLTMAVSGFFSTRIYLECYTQASRALAWNTGRILSEDLNRLLLAGVSLESYRGDASSPAPVGRSGQSPDAAPGSMAAFDRYLRNISANTPDQSVILKLLDPQGRVAASSHPPETESAETLSFLLPLTGRADRTDAARQNAVPASSLQNWKVSVALTRDAYRDDLRILLLNVLTLVVIALMLMSESFLLVFHYAGGQREGPEKTRRTSPVLRALLFLGVLGVDLSISFIPLCMEDFAGNGEMHPMLLGLPVSMEILLAGCGIFIAGIWTKRRGIVPPMTCGFCLAALGCLASMLAAGPVQFILARGLAGAGYGLIILPPQAEAVKEGKIAFLFAGVYAGSLCGSALGAMLADSLGYVPVFGVSALILLSLAILPILLFGRGPETCRRDASLSTLADRSGQSPALETAGASPARWRQIRSLAADPAFLALALFSLIPASFLAVGLLNFFLPLFLHDAGMAQSDIGRIFMLYCLIIIYAGPRIESLGAAPQHKPRLVFLGGAAGAAAIGSFALLSPLPASLCAAVFLGLATCCNLPGQSGCLLRLRLARSLGVEFSMSILNTLERVGQMLGPPCVGLLLAVLGAARLSLWAGIAVALTSLAFLLSIHLLRPDPEGRN